VPASVTNISCIIQVTFKFMNKALLANSGWLDFSNFKVFVVLSCNGRFCCCVATVTEGLSCVSLRGTVNHRMRDDETNATIFSGEIRLKRGTRLQGRAVTLSGTGI